MIFFNPTETVQFSREGSVMYWALKAEAAVLVAMRLVQRQRRVI